MSHLPTTKQLRYFVALEHHEHFGKAAESCFVSQPAFSVAIKELENMLNIQLVDRTNKNVTITSLGRDIARQARVVLRDLEDLVEMARGNQAPLTGQLKLGVIPTIAPFLLPALLPALREAYPDLRLYLKEDLTERVYERLMEGELDLLLVALPYELRNVVEMPLFDDHFFLAHHKRSRFVSADYANVSLLPSDSVLLLEDGHCLRDHALSACNIKNADKVSSITATSLLTLVQMVDADLGVTYLPEMAIHSPLLKNTQIATEPLEPGSYRQIGLVWRKASTRHDEFAMLGDFIRSHYRPAAET
ncbi:LysR substrate-binding domain-containing protein [Pseudohongiella sp. SYSU M77423]|uniref:hydrogen peroxide-inducible genes activator n=1 Tax=unclassified Pseudohongiella TaxID=2629611 RepID=UPI000C5D08BF|nr:MULTISPECIES: hydrogen peroxide-inducible genes activator [unclassified Pseudohongiella]MAY55848.1 LysR family transcriptional regulator [Gammaproteobacteria bacterium]MBJ55086.1 LysR family transcriptional regulator [Gammaproteobacteria bacterium]MDH7943974.1 LysR substrate-binding domain-containing protein [Pseudohongiella sp. SYSU M77423]HBN15624.1 LysR family transcriptional regulator [Pseudohongiella sp.]|tara:strand:- start:1167 stop:2078 length:912 start_codon:yes stop_codon:yes gene_type:complete